MELVYVFGVALGLALLVGLMVRKAMECKDAHDRALAAFFADRDLEPQAAWAVKLGNPEKGKDVK